MNSDIITIGEPLIEFSAAKEGCLNNSSIFYQSFGGDTSNFSVSAARCGAKVGYVTSIGADPFGEALLNLWENEGIDVTHVKQESNYKTGVYFISRNSGSHQFTYYRANSAASRMTPEILPQDDIRQTKILHLSGITQGISSSACETNAKAIAIARESDTLITYDPNLRTDLWPIEKARAIIHNTVSYTDILMPSYEDARMLTALNNPEEICNVYLKMGAKIVILKMGQEGALLADGGKMEYFSPHPVDQVDSSGAGDTFCGAFAAEFVTGSPIEKCVQFAGIAAAISTKGIGCIAKIPRREDILSAMEEGSLS